MISLRSIKSGWRRLLKTRLWISFKKLFSKIWAAKFGVRFICGCSLSRGFYGIYIFYCFQQCFPAYTRHTLQFDGHHQLHLWDDQMTDIFMEWISKRDNEWELADIEILRVPVKLHIINLLEGLVAVLVAMSLESFLVYYLRWNTVVEV